MCCYGKEKEWEIDLFINNIFGNEWRDNINNSTPSPQQQMKLPCFRWLNPLPQNPEYSRPKVKNDCDNIDGKGENGWLAAFSSFPLNAI